MSADKTEEFTSTHIEKVEHPYGDKDAPSIAKEFTETLQFTWRSAIVGSLLGSVIACSNMYLGLSIGWSFGASLFGAIFSFAILKPLTRVLPLNFGGAPFGPKENCTAQTAATAAGGLSAGFVSAIPAMYKLNLLQAANLDRDMASFALWTLSAAFYGLFFAVPLRKQFVIHQDLVFPTPRATAITIQSLHQGVSGEKEAMKKAYWLGVWFVLTCVWTILTYFMPGILDNPRILYHIGRAVGSKNLIMMDEDWDWAFKFEWSFFGVGLMSPGSTVFSFLVGQIISFGIAGPLMWGAGIIQKPFGFNVVTAQSWWLWPGISLMVFSSFSELFVNYKVLWRAVKIGGIQLKATFTRLRNRNVNLEFEQDPSDPLLPHEQVPQLWWIGGLVASIIFTCIIMGVFFGMAVYLSLLAIILSFVLSFVGLQSSGETDINPVGSIGKVTQLVFAAIPGSSMQNAQMVNLMAGNMAGSAAAQSVDMVGDLKTGHLIGASPRSQFYAQIIGSVFAIGIALGLFYLYAKAYPCILAPKSSEAKCEFSLYAANVWAAVTEVLTGGTRPPQSSLILSIVFAVLSVVFTIIKHKWIPPTWHPYLPNLNALGIGLSQKGPYVPIAMTIGWVTTYFWRKYRPEQWDKYMYSVAAGSLAGIGIGSIVKAFLKFGNVPGDQIGIGCLLNDKGEWSC
ncbi:uncharacterized protein VTP21DRAFT_3893 [Calcarisporiella thermophila]|uniref:uncharacterized protein n=1 Tax=Calcarisporiella thermophila TaxID=911321 RepID=UPI00374435FF